MKHSASVIAAAGCLALASASFAGFTVSATKVPSGGFDRWDIVAINTGGDTGTQIKGLEYFYSGSPVAFEVIDSDENGVPDTVNLRSTSRTRVRVSASTNTYVGLNPEGQGVEPNPYVNPLSAFSGAIANTGTTQATGTGYQIARLFLPTGGSGTFSGNLGGDIGQKQPFSVTFPDIVPPVPPPVIINNNASTNVVFAPNSTQVVPFSMQINATSADAGDALVLSVGPIPAGISDVIVAPASSTSPASFTVTGLVDYSLNGTTVNVPIRVALSSNPLIASNGQFSIVVTPEPASALALVASVLLQRRRD